MPISGLHDKGLNQEHQLMPQVFPDQRDTTSRSSEDVRRRVAQTEESKSVPQAAAAQPPATQTFGGTPPASTPSNIPVPSTIDRLHKEAGSVYGGYVFVGHDHDKSESDQVPPANPGYRSAAATASSLTDGYNKALMIAGLFGAPQQTGVGYNSPRVVLIILGGRWKENLNLTSSSIDIEGRGRPLIQGNITIGATVSGITLKGLECASFNQLPACTVQPGPITSIPLPNTLAYRESTVRFEDCIFRADKTAFEFWRVVYCVRCEFWQTLNQDLSLELATIVGHGAAFDQDWSVFAHCRFVAYSERASAVDAFGSPFPPLMSPVAPIGYAIRATTRTVAPDGTVSYIKGLAGLTNQTNAYYILPTSGMRLLDCQVEGMLLCEGWTVQHVGGTQRATGRSGITGALGAAYARLRGFAWNDPGTGVLSQIPARVFFEHGTTTARYIADFVPDVSQQSSPYNWGGHVNFRKSEHLLPSGVVGAGAFANLGTAAEADIVQSSTNATSWVVSGVPTNTYGDCPTSVPSFAQYDPYNFG